MMSIAIEIDEQLYHHLLGNYTIVITNNVSAYQASTVKLVSEERCDRRHIPSVVTLPQKDRSKVFKLERCCILSSTLSSTNTGLLSDVPPNWSDSSVVWCLIT